MFVLKILLLICLSNIYINNMAYGRPINEITETRDTPETQIPAGFSEANMEELKPSEVQKAVCTVTSGDVRASAEAFTTRELKGVCGSSEMLKAFGDLESRLKQELENIQKLVQDLHYHLLAQNSVKQSFNESLIEPITSAGTGSRCVTTPSTFEFRSNSIEKTTEHGKNYYLTPKLKSLSGQEGQEATITTTVREKEISKYNNTLTTNKNVKVYTYYWRMENFTQNIKSVQSLSMESPIFSIRGKAFKIKAHFQYLHRDYLYLQLEDYSSVPQLSLGNSIILDTGGMFKEIGSDNFKYKMSILDQNKKRSSDLVSQEFDNYETGFSIPNSALIDSPFIKDDSLLIQLFLYLK